MTADSSIIHIARLGQRTSFPTWLLLRKMNPNLYTWFLRDQNHESPTGLEGISENEALQLTPKQWENQPLTFLNCGFLFTLPERDEIGTNALFRQMKASYDSPSGVFFDEGLGHNCIVKEASIEALDLMRQLEQ